MPANANRSPATSDTPTESGFGPRERLAIWLLLTSAFVVILNETIMSVALPKLMSDLDITAASGQWLTTAFLLTMSVVIPITGMLIQRLRTRTLFTVATGLFSAGTLIAAVAPGFLVLLLGRIVQAGGTAIMMPLLMTTVVVLVPERQRGRLMGRIAIVISVAPALGPTVSGLILQWLSWRWLFLFVLPIALASLLIGLLRLPNVGTQRIVRVDALSVLLSVIGFGGIVWGLSASGEGADAEHLIPPVVLLGIGLAGLLLFVWRQLRLQREDRALLDLRTFRTRPFALAVVLFAFASISLFGTLILLPIYGQNVLGFSVLESGLVLLPGGLLMGLLGPVVGRLVDQRGARFVLVPGLGIAALALWSMALLTDTSTIWQVLASHIALSLGLAGVYTPLFAVSLGSLPGRLASHGSATLSTVQQVGGAAGTALFVTVMSVVSAAAAGPSGVVDVHALSEGTRAAFLVGAITMTIGALIAPFVTEVKRSPAAPPR